MLRPTVFCPSPRDPTPHTIPVRVCPDCAGPLVHADSCVSCRQCGWGRCG